MKTNHIKSDKSLRGIGRLDWGSENKLHSTIKRITSLEDDSNKNPKKKNKERFGELKENFRKKEEGEIFNHYICKKIKIYGYRIYYTS